MIDAAKAAVGNLFRNDRWIPMCFVGMFLVVASVNAVFIYLAVNSWTGLVTEQPNARGTAYNEVLEAERRQQELGWSHEVGFSIYPDSEKLSGYLRFALTDREGRPIDGARAGGVIERIGKFSQIFRVDLSADRPGLYEAPVKLPVPGVWRVRLVAHHGEDTYRIDENLLVRR